MVHQLGVTLEELYNGAVRKLALQKSIICDKCEGRGGKKGAVEKCQTCRGNGIEVKIHMIAPGMAQQIEQVCSHCHGQGEIIAAKDRCKTCNGKKTVRDRKILEVHIEKGMRDGQKIVFSGEGDQEPDLQPGDIVIVLEETEHAVFKRSKQDLVMTMPLQLVESLCGFQKVIKTLDNRDLVVTNLPGEVVKHDSFKSILGEGMPQYKNPFEKGRLIIQFQIVFPEKIPQTIVADLEKCLPPRPRTDIPIDAEECNMVSSRLTLLSDQISDLRRSNANFAFLCRLTLIRKQMLDNNAIHGKRMKMMMMVITMDLECNNVQLAKLLFKLTVSLCF